MFPNVTATVLALSLAQSSPSPEVQPEEDDGASWPQWGGSTRTFRFDAKLAKEWPSTGPPVLWSRPLGDGYSTLVIEQNRLYTLYRKNLTEDREYIVALDALDGETLWEYEVAAPLRDDPDSSGWGGFGPNSTPLVVGPRLFAIGSQALLVCIDKKSGELLWKHDLRDEFRASDPAGQGVGFCASPIAYRNSLIIAAGCAQRERHEDGEGGVSLLAFDQADGHLLWSGLEFEVRGASPLLIHCLGRDQLVLSTSQGLLGVDPATGVQLWRHSTNGGEVSPVWNGDDLLFYSTSGNMARGLAVRLQDEDGEIKAERWWGPRADVTIWQPTPVHDDGVLYGCSDDQLLCVDMESGDCLWREDGYPVATGLRGGEDQLILLDENGWLTVATATPMSFEAHARFQVAERYAYAAPSMVGSTLFVRTASA